MSLVVVLVEGMQAEIGLLPCSLQLNDKNETDKSFCVPVLAAHATEGRCRLFENFSPGSQTGCPLLTSGSLAELWRQHEPRCSAGLGIGALSRASPAESDCSARFPACFSTWPAQRWGVEARRIPPNQHAPE